MTFHRDSISAAEVVAAYLRTREAANGTNWPVYVGTTPASKLKTITVYDTPGRIDGQSLHDGEIYEHNGIQVKIEGQTHPIAYEKAQSLLSALVAVANATVRKNDLTYTIHSATATSSILTLGQGGANRGAGFTFNLVVSLSQT
jgi:hypothetical protein